MLPEFHGRLEAFWSGASPELPEWLVVTALGESAFEAHWQEADAMRLLDFYDRHLAPAVQPS